MLYRLHTCSKLRRSNVHYIIYIYILCNFFASQMLSINNTSKLIANQHPAMCRSWRAEDITICATRPTPNPNIMRKRQRPPAPFYSGGFLASVENQVVFKSAIRGRKWFAGNLIRPSLRWHQAICLPPDFVRQRCRAPFPGQENGDPHSQINRHLITLLRNPQHSKQKECLTTV